MGSLKAPHSTTLFLIVRAVGVGWSGIVRFIHRLYTLKMLRCLYADECVRMRAHIADAKLKQGSLNRKDTQFVRERRSLQQNKAYPRLNA